VTVGLGSGADGRILGEERYGLPTFTRSRFDVPDPSGHSRSWRGRAIDVSLLGAVVRRRENGVTQRMPVACLMV